MTAQLRRWRRLRVWLIPALVTLALCLPGLVNPRWAVDMGWYAGISRGILERADPWFLHAGDHEFFNKPPLAFWIHAAFLWVFGGHAWSVRLPGVLGVCACTLATVAIARRLNGPRAAMFAGIILGSTPEMVRVSTQFRLDVFHTLFILLAALGVVAASKREQLQRAGAQVALPMLASGIMIGLALLTKPFFGPLVFVYMAPWLIWRRTLRTLLWMAPALLVGVAIAAPWHIAMAVHYGRQFIDEYVGHQVVKRAMGSEFKSGEPRAYWWYYLGLMAGTYWPWAVTLVLAVGTLLRRRGRVPRRDGVVLALGWSLFWVVSVTLFGDKRRQYLLPAYPGMAWLSGAWLAGLPRLHRSRLLRTARLEAIVGAGLLVALGWTTVMAIRVGRHPPEGWPRMIEYLRRERPAETWAGAIDYNHSGMVGALTGRWPRTIDWSEDYRTPPPPGAAVLFSEGPPPAGAEVLFRSGDVVLVRWLQAPDGPHDHAKPPPGFHPWLVR